MSKCIMKVVKVVNCKLAIESVKRFRKSCDPCNSFSLKLARRVSTVAKACLLSRWIVKKVIRAVKTVTARKN